MQSKQRSAIKKNYKNAQAPNWNYVESPFPALRLYDFNPNDFPINFNQ